MQIPEEFENKKIYENNKTLVTLIGLDEVILKTIKKDYTQQRLICKNSENRVFNVDIFPSGLIEMGKRYGKNTSEWKLPLDFFLSSEMNDKKKLVWKIEP